ncbi:uncharacterized protein (UPF0335 family) [Pseudochelatococcus lubricantis]|uniref:Uncharacterized protein (UPF0335 family) n=1 Tax=Pseudochelatococcus lubricantis TaxID=1538102 RepID=A0ABX0V020_9HYPH|nr:uncharacterized protein (UPF0335 family) [Pseudochelatococcus lubricantis]
MTVDIADTGVATDELKAFVERIERLEEEKAAISDDIKEVYAELKGRGFDAKAIRKIVALRKPARDTIITVIREAATTQQVGTPAFWSHVAGELGVDRDHLSDLIDEYGIVVAVRLPEREGAV